MKSIIEISRYHSGEKDGNVWVRLLGIGEGGRHSVAHVATGGVAAALRNELDKLVPEGEDIASRRLLLDFEGNYGNGKPRVRNGKPETRADGSPAYSRVFYVDKFTVLNGPTLELARNRRDAAILRTKAESLAKEGRFEEAYGILDDLAARVCNLPPRTPMVIDEFADDVELGETADVGSADVPPETPSTLDEFPGSPSPVARAPESVGGEGSDAPVGKNEAPEVVHPTTANSDTRNSARDPEASAAHAFAQEDAQLAAATRHERKASLSSLSDRPLGRGENTASRRDVLDDEAPGLRSPAPSAVMRPSGSPTPARQPALPPEVSRHQPREEVPGNTGSDTAVRQRTRRFGMRPAGFQP